MRRIIPLACFVFLVVLSGSVSAATPVTGCGTLSIPGETYVLSNDINTSGTCITIGADDITFDGNGHTITGSGVLGNVIYGVYLSGRTGITVKNLKIERFVAGIRLDTSSGNTITDNNASSNNIPGSSQVNMYGIYLKSSRDNTIANNIVNGNHWGIDLSNSSSNIIENNTANSNNQVGITLGSSSNNNTLTDNTLNSNNFCGIELYSSSDYNIITNNVIKFTNRQGIILASSSGSNNIYNNLFNNYANFGFYGTNSNSWNASKQAGTNIVGGPYLGGNFWAKPDGTGFSETCTDVDSDGICDSNYTLASGNVDYLPLAVNFAVDTHPPAQRRHRHFKGNVDNARGNVDGNVDTNIDGNYPGNVGNYDNGGNVGNFDGNVDGNTDTNVNGNVDGGSTDTGTNENILVRLWQWLRGSGR